MTRSEQPDDENLTRRQAAAFVNVSEKTLERLARDGGGPPLTRVSKRRVVYQKTGLSAWMQSRTFGSLAHEMAHRLVTSELDGVSADALDRLRADLHANLAAREAVQRALASE